MTVSKGHVWLRSSSNEVQYPQGETRIASLERHDMKRLRGGEPKWPHGTLVAE